MLTPTSNPALLRLGDASLPGRVHTLLQLALDATRTGLSPLLRECLVDLYWWPILGAPTGTADAAPVELPEKQQVQLQRDLQQLETQMAARLESALARVRQRPAQAAKPALLRPGGPLQLVSLDAPDADTLMRELALRMNTRAALPLHQLNMRMAALAAAPPMESAANPLGPQCVLESCHGAWVAMRPDAEQTLQFLQCLEKRLLAVYADLVDAINTALQDGGLLVDLGVVPSRALSAPTTGTASARSTGKVPSQATDPADPPATADHRPDFPSQVSVPASAAVIPATTVPAAASTAPPNTVAAAPLPGSAAQGAAMPQAVRAQLDQQLAQLQGANPNGFTSVADIRQAMAANGSAGAGVAQAAQPAFGMVGAFLESVQQDTASGGADASLVQAMLVPLLRAAVDDPDLPDNDQHPARRLLTTMVQARHDWHDPHDEDPSATLAIRDALSLVHNGYQGDARVFDQAEAELQQRLNFLSRRAQLAERRHVEAARGQERLTIARLHVEELLKQLVEGAALPSLFRTLLEQSWQDVLVLTRLRHAADAPRWLEQVDVTRQLVERFRSPDPQDDPELRTVVEMALSDIGYLDADAASIAMQLVPVPGPAPDPDEQQRLADQLCSLPHVQPVPATEPAVAPETPVVALPPRSAEEQQWHERLMHSPYGLWLEWRDETTPSQWLRRRLAWFGTVTDRALIVNAHGHRVMDTSLDAIARLMAAGSVRLADAEAGAPRLLERAWQAAKRALRLGQSPRTQQPPELPA